MFPTRETPAREPPISPMREPPPQILVPVAPESPKSKKKATPSSAANHEVQPPLPCTTTKLGFPALSEVDYMDPMPNPGAQVLQHFKQEPSYYFNLAHLTSFRAADKAIDPVHRSKWMDAAQAEASALEEKGTWVDDIPIADAKSKVLPGTWVPVLAEKETMATMVTSLMHLTFQSEGTLKESLSIWLGKGLK